jgi:hypothetical protein
MECLHEKVYFGSGDYYIFCLTCDRRWVTINRDEKIDSTISNNGAQSGLSGEQRVKQ